MNLKLAVSLARYEFTYDWSWHRMMRRLRCAIHHDWERYQDTYISENGLHTVIAFKVCKRCAKSKLIHILA